MLDVCQHATLRAPVTDSVSFGNELSRMVLDGWTVTSSGFDGYSQCWWAILMKMEES